MKKPIFIYGLLLAGLVGGLKFLEYRFFIRDLSIEIYIGIIAAFFTVFGIWVGLKLINKKPTSTSNENFMLDETMLKKLGISKREHDVLELMATGLSNQEIADKLFVTVSTVKTHSSNLFLKLDVQRRTQAIKKAKELQLIP
ncbi:response regulator transcription factor [Bacteroidales bacterium AH-315-I05]|nr:response regulator transcription factor [Bacteroidales bacterium AH-315-I05]